jgi:predicted transglutaminase-like cysteine proteinase
MSLLHWPLRRFCWAWLLVLLLSGGLRADLMVGDLLHRAEQLYGPLGDGRGRIIAWREMLESSRSLSDADKLQAVNQFFNRVVAWRDDMVVWHVADYWATPIEALMKGAGDCEDYAIAKYVSLRELGFADDKLRITYVKALRLNQAHMVLAYYATPTATPLVLDNIINDIVPAPERRDLLPVYSFNGGGLWLPGRPGNEKVGDSKRLSRWQDLLGKMRAEGLLADMPQ